MKLDERMYNGDRAREVLENEAFIAAMADIRQEIIEEWEKTPARDQEGREKLWQLLKMQEKLKGLLQSTLETGKLAKLELEHKQTLAQRAREWAGLA
ncbi:MAG TPA: hypothetical protein VF472_21805 [Burkholderiaceae bacterium]